MTEPLEHAVGADILFWVASPILLSIIHTNNEMDLIGLNNLALSARFNKQLYFNLL